MRYVPRWSRIRGGHLLRWLNVIELPRSVRDGLIQISRIPYGMIFPVPNHASEWMT